MNQNPPKRALEIAMEQIENGTYESGPTAEQIEFSNLIWQMHCLPKRIDSVIEESDCAVAELSAAVKSLTNQLKSLNLA